MDTQLLQSQNVTDQKPAKHPGGRPRKYHIAIREEVILHSWAILREFYNSDKVSLKQKAEIASRIAVKAMPTSFDADGLTITVKDLVSDVKRRQEHNRVTGFITN